jgi:hypothetical protein
MKELTEEDREYLRDKILTDLYKEEEDAEDQ